MIEGGKIYLNLFSYSSGISTLFHSIYAIIKPIIIIIISGRKIINQEIGSRYPNSLYRRFTRNHVPKKQKNNFIKSIF